MARWREVLLEIDRELQRLAPSQVRVLQTLDPTTLLLTACVECFPDDFALPPWVPKRTMELEFEGAGPHTLAELAAANRPAGALSGTPDHRSSARYQDILAPLGIADDLRVVFRSGGTVWGAALLYRGDGSFDDAEVTAVASRSDDWGRRVRLGILEDAASSSAMVGPPGLARIDGDDFVDANEAAVVWLDTLATEQRMAAASTLTAPGARSVTFVGTAGPVTVHSTGRDDAAVIVERAGPAATGEVLMAAYGLTPRERDVVELVAYGHSVAQMARRLGISGWTTKDHLKAVHRKVGVGSRTELLAELFARHFAPSLGAGRAPVRGDSSIRPTSLLAVRTDRVDQHSQYPDRGVGAGVPDAGAVLPAAAGFGRCGVGARWRGDRAGSRDARGCDGVAHHGAAGESSEGARRR